MCILRVKKAWRGDEREGNERKGNRDGSDTKGERKNRKLNGMIDENRWVYCEHVYTITTAFRR